jgi:hypothetical protein
MEVVFENLNNDIPNLHYWKIPGLDKKCRLNLLNFVCHLLQNSLLGNVDSDPAKFSTLQKAPWESFSLMLSSTVCNSLWMSDTVSKRRPFSFIFNLGNSEITGSQFQLVGRMGNNSHVVVSHKICGCQGLVAAALS